MFGVIHAADDGAPQTLLDVAREFSPRLDACGPREIVLDLNGLARLFGDARAIADAMRRTAADRGLRVRIAIAGTRTAARLMVRHRAGITCLAPGAEAASLAELPLALLPQVSADTGDGDALVATFRRWGVRTLGELAALPGDEVAARVGQHGVRWQTLARGEDLAPLVPTLPEERFEQAFDLEWPIDGLEPLSFVLSRLMEPLAAHLERRGRAAAVLRVRLHLVTREVHERALQLPAAIRDPRTLRTLALLDLDSHPPAAAIDRVVVAVDPTPERVLQHSLLARPLPPPAQMATLMARLSALVGEGQCGAPAEVDTWEPGACTMRPFAPVDAGEMSRMLTREPPAAARTAAAGDQPDVSGASRGVRTAGEQTRYAAPQPLPASTGAALPALALRRFRRPVPVRVRVEGGRPVQVLVDRRGLSGGRVDTCAGPWRTSGAWWYDEGPSQAAAPASGHGDIAPAAPRDGGAAPAVRAAGEPARPGRPHAWDRDEWDVAVSGGTTYRLFRDRVTGAWFIEAVVD